MEALTGSILASAIYDIFKTGAKFTSDTLKDCLKKWIIDDALAEEIISKSSKMGINEDMSELAIAKKFESNEELINILKQVKPTVSHNSSEQRHYGTGDNIVQNHIGNGHNIINKR